MLDTFTFTFLNVELLLVLAIAGSDLAWTVAPARLIVWNLEGVGTLKSYTIALTSVWIPFARRLAIDLHAVFFTRTLF